MELFTERFLLKDILPEKAKDIAQKYKLKEDSIEFIRKKTPLNPADLKIEDGERAAIRYVNTADLDRDNEIVLPSGGQVNDFKKSPTVLYAHDYRGLPIGKDIWIKLIQGKGWLAKTVYAKHQLASDIYNLVKEKFLNTSSIGFIPLESVSPDKKGWDKTKDVLINDYSISEKMIDKAKKVYTKWILLEHSDVPIPSNMSALNIAVGKGLEIKSQELIDDLELEIIDEKEDKKIDEFIDETEEVCPECGGILKVIEKGKHVHCTKCDWGEDNRNVIELEEKEVILKPEETDDYIRIPVRDCKVTATITISANEGIKALYCGKIKKIRTYLFAKAKGWTMAKAKKWVADHGKEYDDIDIKDFEVEENNETHKQKKKEPDKPEEKEEPNKGFSLDEIYEIIKENKELITALEDVTAELKAGAVLNKKNKADLKNAQTLIQNVLDSAETAEPPKEGKEVDELEIEEPAELEIDEKDGQEQEGDAEEKEEIFDIDEKDLVKIINSTLQEQLDKSAEKISKNLKEDLTDNFKRLTGKVM